MNSEYFEKLMKYDLDDLPLIKGKITESYISVLFSKSTDSTDNSYISIPFSILEDSSISLINGDCFKFVNTSDVTRYCCAIAYNHMNSNLICYIFSEEELNEAKSERILMDLIK